MHQYLHVSPNTIIEQWLETIMYWIMWTSSIYTGCAWTIDNGSANIGYVEPYKPRPILDKVLEYLAVLIIIIQTAIQSKERTKRHNELRSNLRVHITESLGGRKNEVLYFRTVATLPMKQGHGYGSTLTRIVTSLGNAQGKDIWLVSSNTAMNTGFYTKHGFVTVSSFELGNENPSWKGSPIPIHIRTLRVIGPRLMRYGDIWHATAISAEALKDDPLTRYFTNSPGQINCMLRRIVVRLGSVVSWISSVSKGNAWVTSDGDAMIACAQSNKPVSWAIRMIGNIGNRFSRYLRSWKSSEEQKRMTEFGGKVRKMISETLGGKTKEMIWISSLATAVEKQRQGYGSMLGRHVLSLADEQGRECYLVSSNVKNQHFYNQLGFHGVASFELGAENPTWKEVPIIIELVRAFNLTVTIQL
ncbi:hypothetical protein C8Q75DRAFT_802560 [Abortiporus biennis]|nr:hypothetical protein C8Q75DRAFT_802560 [Abortiporus biennis]